MIGAPGLGQGVLSAVQRSQVGSGFVYGVGIVILAIIMDRFTQALNRPSSATQEPTKAAKKKKTIIGILVAVVIVIFGVIGNMSSGSSSKGTIMLAYAEADDQVASTNVIAQVLEDQGYDVQMTSLDIPVTWQAVAKRQADAMVGAWLPVTHKAQYDQYKDDLDNLGPHITKQAKLGLVVPAYMKDVNSIEDLKDQAGKKITGIEPGAGITAATKETLKAYPNLEGWKQTTSSTGAMTTQLERSVKAKEDIIVEGWNPHWMFQRYDLKYLKDPKGTMGKAESIYTMARKGLKKDQPGAYKILDKFHWDVKDLESVMLELEEGKDPEDAARDWINKNQDKVDEWTK